MRDLRVSRRFVSKWKRGDLQKLESFQDKPRSGRPPAISNAKIKVFKREIEKDGPGNIKRVTEKFRLSRRTVQRTILRLGGKRKSKKLGITFYDRDIIKRKNFVQLRIHQDFKKLAMFDDKVFRVPP